MNPLSRLDNIRRKLRHCCYEDTNAAVAIIFRERKGKLELLLVKRAIIQNDPWSGDMAFPGGKKGAMDQDIMQTVSREVMEEINIDLGSERHLGSMDSVHSRVKPDMVVLPLVYLQESETTVRINDELTSFHWVSFNEFKGAKGKARVKDHDVPVFRVDGEIVWGLTYRIIKSLLELAKSD